jgi:8-amino-7-oxononanoate synthase
LPDPLAWIDLEAADRESHGLTRSLRTGRACGPGRIEIDGRELVNFGSNDYLGLAADPRVLDAAARAIRRSGWGSGSAPLVSGWREEHESLSRALADFEKVEAVALFPSGFAANLGVIAALVGPGDATYHDRLNHASLIAGGRLSGARLRVFPHRDVDRLRSILQRDCGRFRRGLIVTDSVFSMDGDLAPLDTLTNLADEFGLMLMVDEAHGTGLFGPEGAGVVALRGLEDRITIRVGTLSKALGSIGGFVAGSKRLIGRVVNHASTFIYSTSLPPAAAAAAFESLQISRREPQRREQVHRLAELLRSGLRSAGLVVAESEGAIVPVIVGDAKDATALSARLQNAGLFVPAIRPPTVPPGSSRLRLSVTASHALADVERCLAALR